MNFNKEGRKTGKEIQDHSFLLSAILIQ